MEELREKSKPASEGGRYIRKENGPPFEAGRFN
jgi:hypothetical protein